MPELWTRHDISEMSEADLRVKILIPLFRSMGYLDVVEYHGGPQEQGKDIVMWKRDPLVGRVNFAVVVKAKRITGQAEGKDSASALVFQIQQCLGRPYQDPRASEERHVHYVIAVSSKEIKKEAAIAVTSALTAVNREKQLILADGDQLWDWIVEYLPASALKDLAHLSRVFEQIDDDIRLTARIGGGQVQIGVEPKPGRTMTPIKMALRFPQTPEGTEAHAAFSRHLRTGAPVELDGRFVSIAEVPPALRSMFSGPPARLGLGPAAPTSMPPIRLRMEIESHSGEMVTVGGLSFKVVHSGTDEATLTNADQALPWTITLVLVKSTRQVNLNLTLHAGAYPVNRAIQVARLQSSIAMGGTVRLVNEDNEMLFVKQMFPPGTLDGVDDRFIAMLESLAAIQAATGTPIVVPDRDFTLDEVDEVQQLHGATTSGYVSGYWSSFSGTMSRDGVEKTLRSLESNELREVVTSGDETISILGQEVRVGRTLTQITGVGIEPTVAEELRSQLATDQSDFVVRFAPSIEAARCQKYFLKWMPDEEIASLRERFPKHVPE